MSNERGRTAERVGVARRLAGKASLEMDSRGPKEPAASSAARRAEVFDFEVARDQRLPSRVGRQKVRTRWNYATNVEENPRYPTMCERSYDALAEIKETELSNR